MSKIRFRCYHCGRVHAVGAEAAGKRGRCLCGKLMLVPAVSPGEEDSEGDPPPVASPVPSERPGASASSTSSSGRPPVRDGPTLARLVLGVLEILGSLPALAAGLVQSFPATLAAWGLEVLPDPNLLSIPKEFWATIAFTLAALLFLDGRARVRGRKG